MFCLCVPGKCRCHGEHCQLLQMTQCQMSQMTQCWMQCWMIVWSRGVDCLTDADHISDLYNLGPLFWGSVIPRVYYSEAGSTVLTVWCCSQSHQETMPNPNVLSTNRTGPTTMCPTTTDPWTLKWVVGGNICTAVDDVSAELTGCRQETMSYEMLWKSVMKSWSLRDGGMTNYWKIHAFIIALLLLRSDQLTISSLLSHTLKKLVPETDTSRLIQETCTCVGQSARIWYKFFLVQVSCMHSNTALFQHRNCVTRDTSRATWLARKWFCCRKPWRTCIKFFM